MYRPSRHACGGCHFDINFATGEGHLPQDSDDNCSTCHQPFGKEFDASVAGAHTVSRRSIELSGVLVEILGVEFTEPGNKPRVTFSLKSKTGMMDPSALNRLRFTLVGPNEDFDFYVQEDALDNLTANGSNWEYRFRKPLPKEAMGSFSIAVEGRTNTQVLANEGTDDEISLRQVIESLTVPIAVTDTAPVGRREIVEDALCEACHSNLLLHGSNRTNGTDGCQVCHSPAATDEEERPPGSKPESIHFKYLIHKIHRGADLENEFIVYGHNGSVHDEFMEVHFPGDLRDCESCHVPGSYTLPLPDGVLPTETSNTLLDFMMPITSACLSCHDSDSAAIHADSNSTDLGESCETCHGEGKTYGVRRVHAR
jgi:OmcA/MtrC family decaheme c-type cytochrome